MVQVISTCAEVDRFVSANAKVVVDVTAQWCGPCQRIAPFLQKIEENNKDVAFCSVDVDACEQIVQHLGITCMPTFLFFLDCVQCDRLEGADEARLQALVEKLSTGHK